MSPALKSLNLGAMTVDERIALVSELWNVIAADATPGLLTDAQRDELRSRVAEHTANPDDVVPWPQSRAAALRRIGK